MSDNVVLEEEYDPNYVPNKEEIEEYAEFLGMDLNDDEDKELLWIAEEGLKAPLPSEWKPCKTDDEDIYYFNFESGESRWEHPCDDYYKKLYKTEKENMRQKIAQLEKLTEEISSQSPLKDTSIQMKHEFDTLFKNEIETILESDELSSEPSKSPSPSKETVSEAEASKEEPPKEDSKETDHILPDDWKKEQSEECDKQKQLYIDNVHKELEQFKKELEEKQIAEIQSLEEQLQKTIKEKEIFLQNKYEDDLQSKEKEMVAKQTSEMETFQKNHQQKVESLQKTYEKQIKKLRNEHHIKFEKLQLEKEEKLRLETTKWEKEFTEHQIKREAETKKKINSLSEKETISFEEQYVTEIEQRKQNIKAIMHKEYEQWKVDKEEHYKQEKEKQIEEWQEKHKEEIDEIKENLKNECKDLEDEMRKKEESKRDELRNEYKEKYEALINDLKSQNENIQKNVESKSVAYNVLKEKYDALHANHMDLTVELEQNQKLITELTAELERKQNSISQQKHELNVELNEYKQQVFDLQEQQQKMYDEMKQHEVRDAHDLDHVDSDVEDEYDDKSTLDDTSERCMSIQTIDMDVDDADEPIPIPSNAAKWSQYLQQEQRSIHLMRERINTQKKSMRQKQRKLEILKNEWKKERDLVQLNGNNANKQSIKSNLKKRKYELDNRVIELNEKVLEIREASQLLNKRESRLQTLEIEYLRTQNNVLTQIQNPNQNIHQQLNLNQNQKSAPILRQHFNQNQNSNPQLHHHHHIENESMEWVPHPPNYPKQPRECQPRYAVQSNYNTNPMGEHHALTSVISKYVKHNQHTQRTINHHKSWLKAFQCELQSVSHAMEGTKSYKKRRKHRSNHQAPTERKHKHKPENGEVVIRLKIDK